MLTIDDDTAIEFVKLSSCRAEEVRDTESDFGMRRINLVGLTHRRAQTDKEQKRSGTTPNYHLISFSVAASAFKSGVRARGRRPNRFPSAKAGLSLVETPCTPVIRASSVSK